MGAFADEWYKPVFSLSFSPLTVDEPVYLFNTEAKLFLTEGNDYGTHASVGDRGLAVIVSKYVAENSEWDGKTYTIQVYSQKKGSWGNLFIDDEQGNVYVDRRQQENYFFFIPEVETDLYHITGADLNPDYNTTNYPLYRLGRYLEYVNGENYEQTGTGVMNNDMDASVFQSTWAFVSESVYETYLADLTLYETAMQLGDIIQKAEALSTTIDITDEKAVFASTYSSKADIEAAIESVNKKMLKYYEISVTPDSPILIDSNDGSSIAGWTNELNVPESEWTKTGSWIGDGWEGYDAPYLSIWSGTMQGRGYKQLVDLPNGIYVVSLAAYSQSADGHVFANENQVAVPNGAAGKTYKITTEVTDGTLEYGYAQDESVSNWITLDNIVVNYYGSGVEAYRYWLNNLLADAPDFNTAIVQTSLVEAYNQVLASVNTAETKEQILAIIPAYEQALNTINTNIAAYTKLNEIKGDAEDMTTAKGINEYYSNLLADEVSDYVDPMLSEKKASTEEVQAETTKLQAIMDEAQNYIWNIEKLTAEETGELDKAAAIYEENKDKCAPSAVAAYSTFLDKYGALNVDEFTNQTVLDLLQELWDIEFQLSTPAEPASDDNPVDYTAKIQYPSFGGTTGWTNEGWSTCEASDPNASWNPTDGYVLDKNYLNLWNASGTANVYQTVTGLPAGTYVLQISAYCKQEGLQVYANDATLEVVLGTEGDNKTNSPAVAHVYSYNGDEDPEEFSTTVVETDETEEVTKSVITPAAAYGNVYRLITQVGEDGTLTFGARIASNTESEHWAMVDNVSLTYYGDESAKIPTDIKKTEKGNTNAATSIYTLSGTQVNALQKGINIVKMTNGTVKKMLVK